MSCLYKGLIFGAVSLLLQAGCSAATNFDQFEIDNDAGPDASNQADGGVMNPDAGDGSTDPGDASQDGAPPDGDKDGGPGDGGPTDGGPGDGGPMDGGPDDGGPMDGGSGDGGGDACVPEPEVCNGMDDDCSGTADDGQDLCPAGDHASGSCNDGQCDYTCADGYADCDDDPSTCESDLSTSETCGSCTKTCTSPEPVCDNGSCTDQCSSGELCGTECFTPGEPCDGSDGDLCKEGTKSCNNDTVECSDDTGDNQELCDGKDNDCDSSTPDGADEPNFGEPCDGPDSDSCPEGEFVCTASGMQCNDESGDTLETCNGEDDDCDGKIDETFQCIAGTTDTCTYTDPNTGCTYTGTRTCDPDSCEWGACMAPDETCDGKDEDCDGKIDEGLYGIVNTSAIGSEEFGTVIGQPDLAHWSREEESFFGVVFVTDDPSSQGTQLWFTLVDRDFTVVEGPTQLAPGDLSGLTMRHPLVARVEGNWFVAFHEVSQGVLGWSLFQDPGNAQFDQIEAPGALPSQIVAYSIDAVFSSGVFLGFAYSTDVDVTYIDTSGNREHQFTLTFGNTVKDLDLVRHGETWTSLAIALGSRVVYRRFEDGGSSPAAGARVSPTHHTFQDHDDPADSVWIDAQQDFSSSDPQQDRLAISYYAEDTEGFGSFFRILDGEGNVLTSALPNTTNTDIRFSQGHAQWLSTFGLANGAQSLNLYNFGGDRLQSVSDLGSGSYSSTIGGRLGPYRFVRANNAEQRAVGLIGFGCRAQSR